MFTHLLVPLDGSADAERAIPYALDVAGSYSARVTFFGVPVPMEWEEAAEYLEALSARLREEHTFEIDTATGSGDPAAAIAEYAESSGVDLIVMSTQGAGRAGPYRVGSVASNVLSSTLAPILLVRRPAHIEA